MSAAPALPPAPGTAWAHALQPTAEVSRGQTRLLVAAMAALHLGGGWALLQVPAVRQAVRDAAPMRVEWLAPAAPAPETPPPPPPPPAQTPPPRVQPLPVLAAPSPATLPAEVLAVPPPPSVQPAPVVAALPIVTPAPPAPPAAPPPAPRRIDATAVTYLGLPPVEVPRASRRAGERGVVWLRVLVDTRGLPALVQVQRTSGHARLDEQAVWAMRQARFKPHTEDGAPIEIEVIAPIEYLLD